MENNLTVHGSGSYGGGTYGNVKINGEATISGDLDCNRYKILGTSTVKGNTKTKELIIMGESKLDGDVDVNRAKIYGQCNIHGDTTIQENHLKGILQIDGKYRGNIADIKGELIVKGNVEVENFTSSGTFKINGLLNAEEIHINPRFSKSYAKEIGGEKISIRKKSELGNLFLRQHGKVEADVIEGDNIYLEHTTANIVRGTHVEIGAGCNIQVVECSGTYKEVKNTTVKKKPE